MKTLTANYYEILGVGPTSDQETLRKAYRRLAQIHHPDVSSDPEAHENMARINEAFQTLVDPARRSEYDAMLRGGGLDSTEGARNDLRKPVVVKLRTRLKAHMTPVYAVGFAPDTGQLISSAFDNELIWWSPDGKPERRMKLENGVISVIRAFSEERLVAAGSAESQISFWHLNGKRIESWKASNEEWVSCLSISADGNSLACGSLHHTLSVSNTNDGSNLYRKVDHSDAVTAVAWSANGKYLATGSADATVTILNGATGTVMHRIQQIRSTVTAIAFSPDVRYLAVAAVDLSIRIFRLSDGQMEKMVYGHTKPIEALAFHPNSWLIASGSRDGTLGLWNAAKGIGNVRIEASSRPISSVAFSPTGDLLAAGGQDKLVRLWDVTVKKDVA
ncbi:MAG: DnaJ domain-containing protein [Chlorobia bacterium]|nr:DnaJ domain-containing protein [Fimbriimonadaceae bacterium]